MVFLWIFLGIILFFILYAPRGRRGAPGMEPLSSWKYAHRGLHDAQHPENSMAAFRRALDSGYGIELDVHLLRDGNLAVIHDSLLLRTTGREGRVEDLTTEDLKSCRLGGTEETIPTFRQVLDLYAGKAPLIIELKSVGGNYAELTQQACRMMEGYTGPWCMESFDPRCLLWLRRNRPAVVRGQLTENYFASDTAINPVLAFILTHNLLNFLTMPDFVAYNFQHRRTSLTNWVWKRLWRIPGVSWTLKTREEYDQAVSEGLIPIFEGFTP